MVISIISVVILLGVLIFVHELGHFVVAKYSGVGVLKFSLGFGPRLAGKKIGETEYLLSLIPLGGYVKLLGESEDDELSEDDEERSFLKQHVLKKIGIVVAGPFFNFLFAIFVFSLGYMIGVPVLTSEVGDVKEGSAAFEAGIQKEDVILSINDRQVSSWAGIADAVSRSKGQQLKITVRRNGGNKDIYVMPRLERTKNIFGENIDIYRIGVSASSKTVIERQNPFDAIGNGVGQTWYIAKLTLISVVKMIKRELSPKVLGGPILIAQMTGAYAREGIMPFMFFMALLSVNLAILNLLPVPVLDGGHLLFYMIELITGREVNVKWREIAQQVGIALLIILMIFVFYNDIAKIFGK